MKYRIHIRPLSEDEGGGYLATVPDLPGCQSDGETPEEAVVNVQDAIRCWIEASRKHGLPVPEPTPEKVSA
jgi:predicted RNase H-like HicB family nuclease